MKANEHSVEQSLRENKQLLRRVRVQLSVSLCGPGPWTSSKLSLFRDREEMGTAFLA